MSLRAGPDARRASDSEKFGKLRDMPFFKDFGEVELWEVVRVGTWQPIDGGTVLMRENEQGDSFYLLVEGEVEVSLLGKPLATLKPGSCFGEILYFADSTERRTTTITARGSITVMQIKSDAPARRHRRLPGRLQQGLHARPGRAPCQGQPPARAGGSVVSHTE